MSLLIKGQDLPKEGEHYLLQINSDGTVYDAIGRRIAAQAIPIPPHGDLIDRDVAFDYWLCASWDFLDSPTDENIRKVLDATPTIIPAEDGER